MRWECGDYLDYCFYSFVIGYVGVKGSDVNCDKDGVRCEVGVVLVFGEWW